MGRSDPTGGSLELATLIDEYGEILLPELKHHFGIDLRDLFNEVPPFSPRYILTHIMYLDFDSAFVAERRGGQMFRGWGVDRYMTAQLIDAVNALQYITILANRDPDKKAPDPPKPYPLPDTQLRKAQQKTPEPGSFAFIAKRHIEAIRKQRSAQCPAQEEKK